MIGLLLACTGEVEPVRPNVLLITLDTTRADHVLNGRTPNLQALADRGVTFTRAYTPVPITLPAHVTMMTGLDPQQHGVRNNGEQTPPDLTMLAETFTASGWTSAAVIAAAPVRAERGLDQGFAVYDQGGLEKTGADIHAPERPGTEVTQAALTTLEALPEPWFLWVHYFDPHAPWVTPPQGDETPYQAEIRILDEALQPLLAAVDADDVVLVTADHGESLGEGGEPTHGYLLHDPTLHVPFIVAGPEVPEGLTVDGTVRLKDVHPTLLKLAGLSEAPGLTTWTGGGPAYHETVLPMEALGLDPVFAWTDAGQRLVESPTARLFLLPDEQNDVAADDPERVAAMSARLQAERGPIPLPSGRDMDAELVAMGYLDAAIGDGEVYDNLELIRVSMSLYSGTAMDTDELAKVLERWPNAYELQQRGLVLLRDTPHFDEAIVRAMDGFPDKAFIQGMAALHLAPTDPERTLVALDRIDPETSPTGPVLAGVEAWRILGRDDHAETWLRQVLQHPTPGPDTRYDRARAAHAMGWLQPAEADYAIVAAARPEDAEVHRNHGYVLAMLGRTDEAIAALDRSLALDEDPTTRARRDALQP